MKRGFEKYFFVVLFLANNLFGQFYYGLQQEFGKSRVQYQPFFWTYYNFPRYQVFTYEGGQDVAKYVAYQADGHLRELEKRLDFQTDEKLQILVYTNQGDFRQSNLGLSTEEVSNTGGTTKIVGTKVSVYFNGNHANLNKQLRAGIAEVLLNDMLYGGRTRDVIKNSTLLSLPDWFKNGLISYYSETWNTDLDDKVLDGVLTDRYLNFNRLNGAEATIAGHSLFHYLADTYGESTIPNLLYMVKVTRNIESAFVFVLGTNSRGLTFEWLDAISRRNMGQDTTRNLPKEDPVIPKPKSKYNYYQLRISPDGDKIIYATNELSQYKIWLQDINTGKKKRIAKWGPKVERIQDLTYPLLFWHPMGNAFSMIHEKKGITLLSTYQLDDKELISRPITGIEKVLQASYSPDGKKIVMSAVKKGKGQSDIFVFQTNAGGLEQITNDIWDDEFPRFINKGQHIAFSSNRINDTIKPDESGRVEFEQGKNHDMFVYDYKGKSKVLYRVTETRNVHESEPAEFYDGGFVFLSDQNGIRNRYVAKLDSVIAFVDTTEHYRYTFNPTPISNYKHNILEQDVNIRAGKMAQVFFHEGKQLLVISPIEKNPPAKSMMNTYYRRTLMYTPRTKSSTNSSQNPVPEKNYNPNPKDGIDINNYQFKNEDKQDPANFNKQTNTPKKDTTQNSAASAVKSNQPFRLPIQENYYVNFSVDHVTAQLDNSFLASSYQRFTGYYINPGVNGFFKVAMSDLFEDYRIVGGFRISGTLNNEYLISVENRKKLFDKQLILHRLSFPDISQFGEYQKIFTHDVQYRVKYPINEVSFIRGTLYYRNDKIVYGATGEYSLPIPNKYDNWAGLKAEYVYDNTRPQGINLYHGIRLKVFGEYYRKIDLNKRHDLIVYGFDIRHYQKVHRSLIWANRLAGSGSLGTDRLIYYLGGVDNWFIPKFDFNTNIKRYNDYQFQTIATNMRGFKQNTRNGNNFVVFNSELRWPIFRYLLNRPIRSDFINNFQTVGFIDVGTAWHGWDPYSDENSVNYSVTYKPPVTVIVEERKDPVIFGYGLGFRSRLFGYFFRLDFSWGYDNTVKPQRVNYLSFTTDF